MIMIYWNLLRLHRAKVTTKKLNLNHMVPKLKLVKNQFLKAQVTTIVNVKKDSLKYSKFTGNQ